MYSFCFVQQWDGNPVAREGALRSRNIVVAEEPLVSLRLLLLLFSPKWQWMPLFFTDAENWTKALLKDTRE